MSIDNIKDILIIDDEPTNLKIIEDYFREGNLPYTIRKAPSGIIGLRLVERRCPDLIITDWDMPEMDGIEFIKQLKKKYSLCNTPVIMCTGVMTSSENLQTAMDVGAVDYIRKPIDKIELFSRTRSALMLSESYKSIFLKNKELKELNATKDKFFSIIAHDLKSPFNSIIGLSDIILNEFDKLETARLKQLIEVINSSSLKTYKLLENLLLWANSQTGKIKFQPLPFRLFEIVEDTYQLLKQQAKEKQIAVTYNVPESIIVYADNAMISTIFRNLISNAIKFTNKNGSVNIFIDQDAENQSEDWIKIVVKDTGVGIADEKIDKLFDLSETITTLGTADERGTGLGLMLCKDFVEVHQGKIDVESKVGKGSSISFTLPTSKDSINEKSHF